jgi:DNA-binding NtrC family response regulator
MARNRIVEQTILAVFPVGEDRSALEIIFGQSDWQLQFAETFQEAQTHLRTSPVGVVISEGRLPDGRTWKDLLGELQELPNPRPLIVADRLADDRLWAEVLNLGGYDLLMKPFDTKEVLHAVTTASHFGSNQRPVRAKPIARAAG